MTQIGFHARARAAGPLGQRICGILARTLGRPAATERSSPERCSSGLLSVEILRDTGASLAHQDYAGGEAGSAQRLFDIAYRIRLGLPHR